MPLASITRDLVLGFGDAGRSLLSPISKRWFSPIVRCRIERKWMKIPSAVRRSASQPESSMIRW